MISKIYTYSDAKKLLRERNSWWTGLVIEPLVTLTLPFIANKTKLSPNQITVISLALGLLAAFLYTRNIYLSLVVGAFIYQIAFYLDCVDGSLARLKGLQSKFGAMFDPFTDFFSITAASSALGLSYWVFTKNDWVLFFTVLFLITSFYYRLSSSWLIIYVKDYESSVLEKGRGLPVLGWFKKHRLANFPSSVDAETLTLFFGPVLNQILIGYILGSVLMSFHCLRNTYKLFVSLKGQ